MSNKKNNIVIDSGEIRLTINDDPKRVVVFNPKDVLFAQRFYQLIGSFETEINVYQEKMVELEENDTLDQHKLPVNAEERFEVLKKVCEYIREQVDILFGSGTAQMVFEDVINLEMFAQFFTGVTPYIEDARSEKVNKYVHKPNK